MIVAMLVGVIIGVVVLALVLLCSSAWGRRRLPSWLSEQGPGVSVGLIGVLGSVIVARVTRDDGWSLFFVQLGATFATIILLGFPLRHRLRA